VILQLCVWILICPGNPIEGQDGDGAANIGSRIETDEAAHIHRGHTQGSQERYIE